MLFSNRIGYCPTGLCPDRPQLTGDPFQGNKDIVDPVHFARAQPGSDGPVCPSRQVCGRARTVATCAESCALEIPRLIRVQQEKYTSDCVISSKTLLECAKICRLVQHQDQASFLGISR